jgi:hypothetical protein
MPPLSEKLNHRFHVQEKTYMESILYRMCYSPRIRASTGGLATHPPWIKELQCEVPQKHKEKGMGNCHEHIHTLKESFWQNSELV